MRKKMWKRVTTFALAVVFAMSLLTTAEIVSGVGSVSAQAADEQYITVTKDTHTMKTGTYVVKENVTIDYDHYTGNGIRVEKGAKVLLIIEEGKTLKVSGMHAYSNTIGYAAILLPEGSTLTVAGKGTLEATGGNARNGNKGGGADISFVGLNDNTSTSYTGSGGGGGAGGGGAGAGIGTNGGSGGAGGAGGEGVSITGMTRSNVYGNAGKSGQAGSAAEPAGTVIVTGSVTVKATGGKAGTGGDRGTSGLYHEWKDTFIATACGTSGGGGGGAGGSAADGIGSGGTGGGGGGGGASANIDGEGCFFGAADLDDLWGYGGYGGSGIWGGESGKQGFYGASGNGDDTSLSREHAKSGGSGGSSVAPKTVAFYIYKDSASANPQVTCTTGHGVTRSATTLGSLQEFMNKGGQLVSGGTFVYDGQPHGVSIGASANTTKKAAAVMLLSQEAGDEADEEGQTTLDGVNVFYKIIYYDALGNRVGEIPYMPGQYVAVVTFESDNPEYCGDWVEPFTISKIQVEKPTPATLTFECGNWETGEGVEQVAFPELDETWYEFVPDATLDDVTSVRSARAAGSYQACFRLKNPETCTWAGESEDTEEVWIPWSIALQEFDAGDPEITYWGTAYNNNTTAFDYTGEPVWVRPWFTPAKDSDGRYPEWFTHWGSEDRPTTNRFSSAVFYMKGEEDREGLIGYHTGSDGSLEKVTAEQVYAWACGVEIDGTIVPVENGDKVWYKTDEDGWKFPIAVGGIKPEGAEGYVVARDYAYADRLGVKDPGTYQAYTVFDDGAGFVSTSLAEATVVVKKKISGAKVTGITNKTYTGAKITQSKIRVVLDGKTLANGTDYKVTYTNNKNVGTAKVKITGINEYKGTINKTFKITKATQKVKAVTPKNGATKKIAQGKSFRIKVAASKQKGTAQFKRVSGNKKIKISSGGKVTVKKGLVKGGTYTLKYKVRIKATKNYKATKYVTRKVKIKIKK